MTPDSFEIDGIRFVIDTRAGNERGQSEGDTFILVKTPSFLQFYRSLINRRPKNILEIGMFEGGSLVFFDKTFQPERLVGVDIRDEIPALESYRRSRPHIQAFYGQSQDDKELPKLLSEHFPDGIDLIVDDASHQYEKSKVTFELCFPLLKPSGLYVVEDWSWSHKSASQQSTHPWHSRDALTNLIFDLIINLPESPQMNRITTLRNIFMVEKAATAKGAIGLGDSVRGLRGRVLHKI